MNAFSTLGHDVLFEVSHHLSDKPQRKNWLKHVGDDSLNLLIDVNGPFAPCVTDACKSITWESPKVMDS